IGRPSGVLGNSGVCGVGAQIGGAASMSKADASAVTIFDLSSSRLVAPTGKAAPRGRAGRMGGMAGSARIVMGIVLAALGSAALAQADAPLTPARDFSGVWTTYVDPSAAPAAGPRRGPPPAEPP